MKPYNSHLFSWVLLSFFFIANILNAQNEIINQIKEAIASANSNRLAKLFNETVEISFDGEKNDYSNTQAEFVMKDFFKRYVPKSFDYIHQGTSKNGTQYAIGEYKTLSNTFRFYILIKQIKDKYFIDTIDISKKAT